VYGLFTDGNWAKPHTFTGQTSCQLTGSQRCVKVQWLFAQSALNQLRGVVQIPSWHGTLLVNKRDASGLEYKRNRVYDPQTGRFTQEDPIGLAGGVNAYGFANGDPVNFSDPFGLNPCKDSSAWTECLAQALANWGAHHGGVLGGLALNTGAALNAGFEASGVNAAASAGDAIGSGRLGEGGVGLALSIGPMRPGKAALSLLIKDAVDNPGNWRTVGRFIEDAVNKRARGGVSVQQVIENAAGERLVRHTVLDKTGKVIDDHFRPMLKP